MVRKPRSGRFPGVVDYLAPELSRVDLVRHIGRGRLGGEALHVFRAVNGGLHESVVDTHRHVGARHLPLGHLGIDEFLRVGMLYADGQHQGATTSVLRHLTGGIAITLHERHEAGRCQRRVLYRHPLGAYMGEVVAHSSAPLHQLHLLLVDLDHSAVAVGVAVEPDHEDSRCQSLSWGFPGARYTGNGRGGRRSVRQ